MGFTPDKYGILKTGQESGAGVLALIQTLTNIASTLSPKGIIFDGQGDIPEINSKGHFRVPTNCKIIRITIDADQTGSAVVGITKGTQADFNASTMTSIVNITPPTLTNQKTTFDDALAGWTTSINADDIIEFTLESVSTATIITVTLYFQPN